MGALSSLGMGRVSQNIRVSCFYSPTHITETFHSDVLGPNQACTLFGASPGSNVINGSSYIDVGYGLQANELWRQHFLVLLGMLIFFQLTQVLAIECFPVSAKKGWFFRFARLKRP
jgi:hypothetical protein